MQTTSVDLFTTVIDRISTFLDLFIAVPDSEEHETEATGYYSTH